MKTTLATYLEKVINEEFIASDRIQNSFVEIYKNPRTLEGMKAWIRGIILRSGDLYIFNPDKEYDDLRSQFIHSDVVKWMNKNIPGFSTRYGEGDNPLDYVDTFITVDRSEASDIFVLAESYYLDEVDEFIDDMNYYVKNFKIKNPTLDLVIKAYE